MKKKSCVIRYDQKVNWSIPKANIEKILTEDPGLLYLNVETAGKINFKNDESCKKDVCNKEMRNLEFKKGKSNSVMTPLSVVNFHTHPLSCYVDEKCVWGWPSAEDLGQCLNFAKDNNLTHIIFTIEGTYIIDVNNEFIKKLYSKNYKFKIILDNIIEIFRFTHLYRLEPVNLSKEKKEYKTISLEKDFKIRFLNTLGIHEGENILYSWINLVNNLTLKNLYILSNLFSPSIEKIKKIPLHYTNGDEISFDLLHKQIYNIQFVKNETIQWHSINGIQKTKLEILEEFKKKQKNKLLKIKFPDFINYYAPFISGNSTFDCL
tara:strand:+ start:255 stop:1214 length:960 start_codon:yes stop_codon:yes gene_type:complete